jgi:hypothetical protein
MFYSKTEKNDNMIAKSIFKPCLWYKSKFASEKLSYHTDVLSNLRCHDDLDKLTSKEKKRLLHEIFQGEAYYDPEKAGEQTIDGLKQLNAFMDSNYRFERANEEFLECMWTITKSRDYMHSNENGNKFLAASRITKSYQKKNGFPYHWSSSDTLYKSIYPIIYITQNTREHCILLAWRLVFLCLEIAISSIDPCDNLANILKHSDEGLSTNPISKRYINSKAHLMYAYVIINQIIPCHMRQIAGTLSNQTTSSGAVVMPELNPYVASSFSVFILSLIQQNFLINASQHFLKKQMKKEMLINVMAHLLNGKEKKSTDDDDMVDSVEEKSVYVLIVNAFIDLCYENQDIIHMISAIFQLSYQTCMDLGHHAWNHQLLTPYHDIMIQNIDDIFPSKISRREEEFIIKMHAGSEKEKEEALMTIIKRSHCARNMHNYLLGTCVLMECYMSCFDLSQILIHEMPEIVMPMLVNLAKKVEMLMLPIFDRRQSAVEIMAWVIDQFRVRMAMNSEIERLFSTQNSERIEIGKSMSYIWKFMVVDRNQPDMSLTGDFFTTIKSFVASIVPKKDSRKVKGTQFKDILKKTKDSIDEQEEVDLPENTQHYRKLSLPFNDDDIKLWAIIISYYPHVNDDKMKSFSRIELYSYYKTPSKVLIPHGFCKEFNDMLINMARATSKN